MTAGDGLGWAVQSEAQGDWHRSWRIFLGGAAAGEFASRFESDVTLQILKLVTVRFTLVSSEKWEGKRAAA
jgi:hypothetical protein